MSKSRWMIMGSSPTAPDFHNIPDVDYVASSGDAILLREPDYYFIIEPSALWRWAEERFQAHKNGTKVVVHGDLPKLVNRAKFRGYLKEEYKVPFDELLPVTHGGMKDWQQWYRGTYVNCCSGVMALQYAANRVPAPTEIHMVGMEGYTGGVDYFTGDSTGPNTPTYMKSCYAPLTQRIINKLPDTKFTTYGNLTYDLKGKNVSHYHG